MNKLSQISECELIYRIYELRKLFNIGSWDSLEHEFAIEKAYRDELYNRRLIYILLEEEYIEAMVAEYHLLYKDQI